MSSAPNEEVDLSHQLEASRQSLRSSDDGIDETELRHAHRDYEKYGDGEEEGWVQEGNLIWEGVGRERCWKCCLASKKQCRVYTSGNKGEKMKCAWCRRQNKISKDCDCTYLIQQRGEVGATSEGKKATLERKRKAKAPERSLINHNTNSPLPARKRRKDRPAKVELSSKREKEPLRTHLDGIKRDLDLIKYMNQAGLDEYITNIKTRLDLMYDMI